MNDIDKLKSVCDSVIADQKLQPIKDPNGNIVITFCNLSALRVAHQMGCDELSGMADEMFKIMSDNASGQWFKCLGSMASGLAQQGYLVFASLSSQLLGEEHGHIAALYPLPMQLSASLGRSVPMIANIGKENGIMRVTQAFPVAKGEPEYFVYDRTI